MTLFVANVSPINAQIQRGTIGVVYFTDEKIIMASDSRGLAANIMSPDDTICKVGAPDGKFVFVSSGASSYHRASFADPVESWSNLDEINRAYRTVSPNFSSKQEVISQSAKEWVRLLTVDWGTLLRQRPEKVIEAAETENADGALTTAMIGGFGEDGSPIL